MSGRRREERVPALQHFIASSTFPAFLGALTAFSGKKPDTFRKINTKAIFESCALLKFESPGQRVKFWVKGSCEKSQLTRDAGL